MSKIFKLLIGLILCVLPIITTAQTIHVFPPYTGYTYYVDNVSGNDTYNGRSPLKAWKTLAKVNSSMASFTPGVSVLFKRGVTWGPDSLVMQCNGSLKYPVVFGAYGVGANPIITGFVTIPSWTSVGTNLWESTAAISTNGKCNMVSINGINTPMGRYPNDTIAGTAGGYLPITSHSGSTSITSSTLTGTPNWTGTQVVIRSNDWTITKGTISAQTSGTLTENSGITPTDGYGFFIQNDIRTLDKQNEWYFNPSTKKLTIYSIGTPTNVQVASINILVTFQKYNTSWSSTRYITFKNINFTGSNSNAFFGYLSLQTGHTLDGVTIQNCKISFIGGNVIDAQINGCSILSDSIVNCNGEAMNLPYSTNTFVKNNYIHNINNYPGMNIQFSAVTVNSSPGSTLSVQYNKIINVGSAGISVGTNTTTKLTLDTIRNNYIDTLCTIIDDLGGIYGMTNVSIHDNIILNSIGAWKGTNSTSHNLAMGLYFDRQSTNCVAYNNYVSNCGQYSIILNNANNLNIHNNLFYNAPNCIRVNNMTGYTETTNNIINYNQFIAKTSIQYAMIISSYDNTITSFGTFDYNYYCRPIQDDYSIYINQPSTGGVSKTLYTWQSFSSQDSHSHVSSESVLSTSDFDFEFNPNLISKIITLTQPMTDVVGVKYTGTITLPPYTAILLMKDYNP